MERIRHIGGTLEFPHDGILSKTIHKQESGEVDLFLLPKGEIISGHTSSRDASVYILAGEADFTLGDQTYNVKTGDWFFMESGLVHALTAKENLAFLLTLFGK